MNRNESAKDMEPVCSQAFSGIVQTTRIYFCKGVIVMEQRTKLDRIKMLESMHYLILSLNDENAYFGSWVYVVPDCPTDDDFEDIAEDSNHFNEVCELFTRLIKRYGDSGYCTV